MVKRTQKAVQTSSSRQITLVHDRRRTRAMSVYLADHRDSFLEMVPSKTKKDRNKKRKEMERLAREHFNKLSQSEQQCYYDRVARPVPISDGNEPLMESSALGSSGAKRPVEFRSSGEEPHVSRPVEFRSSGEEPHVSRPVEFRSSGEEPHVSGEGPLVEFRRTGDDQASSTSLASRTPARGRVTPPTPPTTSSVALALRVAAGLPSPVKKSRVVDRRCLESSCAAWSAWQPTGQHCPLKDSLLRESKHLRTLYGDAGALETLACAMRILDVVDMNQWKSRRGVKLAVVAGMAAKLIASDEQHVRELWAKFAGKSSEPEVRKLEKQVVMAWARQGLNDGSAA